jgi:hypothetical protein
MYGWDLWKICTFSQSKSGVGMISLARIAVFSEYLRLAENIGNAASVF